MSALFVCIAALFLMLAAVGDILPDILTGDVHTVLLWAVAMILLAIYSKKEVT